MSKILGLAGSNPETILSVEAATTSYFKQMKHNLQLQDEAKSYYLHGTTFEK